MSATPHKNSENASTRLYQVRVLRTKRYLPAALIVTTLIVLSWADRNGWLLATPSDFEYYDHKIAQVQRVVDGDTILIDMPDQLHGTTTTRIRLWGIDCPELAKADPQPVAAEPFAVDATNLTRKLIEGKPVRLRLESHRIRGRFGRVLAHVDFISPDLTTDDIANHLGTKSELVDLQSQDEGELYRSNLAVELLTHGLARKDERWPHSLMEYYKQSERTAIQAQVGIWVASQ